MKSCRSASLSLSTICTRAAVSVRVFPQVFFRLGTFEPKNLNGLRTHREKKTICTRDNELVGCVFANKQIVFFDHNVKLAS